MSTRRSIAGLLGLILLLTLGSTANPRAAAQPASRFFPETGHTVAGRFLAYWDAHGGLDQQGYPLSDELTERDADGQPRTVQYFERAVFELHPEYAGSPYEVLLARLGADEYRERYGPGGAPNPQPNATDPRAFPETGHSVGGLFRAYWEAHGGVEQQGYPLSDEFTEISPFDGQPYRVQYFERAVFEYHPEHAGTPYAVLLAQLGRYRQQARYDTLAIPPPSASERQQSSPVGSARYLIWSEQDRRYSSHNSSANADILGLDLKTGQVITISNAPGDQFAPAISGSVVVWLDFRGPYCDMCAWQADILGKDLGSGATFTVTTKVDESARPAIADRTVTWAARDYKGTRVVVQDLDTAVTEVIPFGREPGYSNMGDPVISNEYIVWAALNLASGRPWYDLRVFDRKTHQVQTLTGRNFFGPGPELAIAGHYVVVAEDSLLLLDLSSGEMSPLYEHFSRFPTIRGDTVVWTSLSADYRDLDLWGLRLTERVPKVLVRDTNNRARTALIEDWLVWQDEYQLHAARLYDVFPPPP